MQNEPNKLKIARYYSSVSVLYVGTLLFVLYLLNPFYLFPKKPRIVYSQAPLPEQIVTAPHSNKQPIISGKPIRVVVTEADNGLNIDLNVIDGAYDNATNSWSLSEKNAHFALPSVLANNTTGNTLIYGHNNKYVFGYLSAIHENKDASAEVMTDNGHTFRYMFTTEHNVSPDDTSIFRYDGAPSLTLQTCSGSFFEYRQLFYFKLVQVDGKDV